MKIKVLSLFDGISVAQQALKELGFEVEYYASEIDKYAISITQKNHPNTTQLGSVVDIKKEMVGEIDLLIGGSPCQDLSIANRNRQGLAGSRSGLFWEYVRILKEVKPKYFVLENVYNMSDEARDTITKELGVEPIMINAALVSAQDRKRYFWTNIQGITQPEDSGILLRDIVDTKKYRRIIDVKYPILKSKNGIKWDTSGKGYFSQASRARNLDSKMNCVPHQQAQGKVKLYFNDNVYEILPEEVEQLQSLPIGYTFGSKTKRIDALGNAFNCAVVKHILSFMKFNN
jgi:DNA (cytosine-5)-methyltransferase 3A